MKNLTKSEKEIMNVLWGAERALTHAEIVSACVERKWRAKSIFSMLNDLLDKGLLFYLSFLRIFYLNDLSADGHRCDGSKKEMQRPDLVEGLPACSICDNFFSFATYLLRLVMESFA